MTAKKLFIALSVSLLLSTSCNRDNSASSNGGRVDAGSTGESASPAKSTESSTNTETPGTATSGMETKGAGTGTSSGGQ